MTSYRELMTEADINSFVRPKVIESIINNRNKLYIPHAIREKLFSFRLPFDSSLFVFPSISGEYSLQVDNYQPGHIIASPEIFDVIPNLQLGSAAKLLEKYKFGEKSQEELEKILMETNFDLWQKVMPLGGLLFKGNGLGKFPFIALYTYQSVPFSLTLNIIKKCVAQQRQEIRKML